MSTRKRAAKKTTKRRSAKSPRATATPRVVVAETPREAKPTKDDIDNASPYQLEAMIQHRALMLRREAGKASRTRRPELLDESDEEYLHAALAEVSPGRSDITITIDKRVVSPGVERPVIVVTPRTRGDIPPDDPPKKPARRKK